MLRSHFPNDQVDAIVARRGLSPFTARAIIEPGKLKSELRSLRAQGFALDDEEQEEGVRCGAAPVYAHDWQLVAAISVSASVSRLTRERAVVFASLAKQIAFDLSAKLGIKAKLEPFRC